jgi:hypothetical protein
LTAFEIVELTANDDILRVNTSDGVALYPAFQFRDDGTLLPGLRDVAAIYLLYTDDSWDLAIWLNVRSDLFQGRSAAEAMRTGMLDVVLLSAQREVRSWSR